jgi:DNA invertase Pin-like site-specific DNA recombinase
MMSKIMASHLNRKAMIYVRQSTMSQVMNNTESTKRQYALQERARALGWAARSIEIIDEDLGQSAKEEQNRDGIKHLAELVSQGKVGGIFALEVSRLSRNSMDWQRLLSICSVADVVVVDETSVYDPKLHDDKLLLDLKGTMSEAELRWLRLRLAGARRNKASRGELRINTPAGYIWQGGYIKDPDQAVQQAMHVLFERFTVEPSAQAVVEWAQKTGYKVPTRRDWGGGTSEVHWNKLSTTRLCNILHNPVYAGVYVYGQYKREQALKDGEIIRTTKRLDPTEWEIRIAEDHQAYISWDQYLKNIEKLKENYQGPFQMNKGAAKDGNALLSGLVICGTCGRRMKTHYQTERENYHCYICDGERSYGGGRCFNVPGKQIDRAVEELFLKTMVPKELELTLAVEAEIKEQALALEKTWKLRIEQAAYQARLCERRYKAVDPDNRVVVRTLEEQWNAALLAVEDLEQQYEQAQRQHKVILTEAERQRIRELAKDLPKVWRSKTTRNDERKAMLRLVIEGISLKPLDVPHRHTCVRILWKSGVVDEITVTRPRRGDNYRTPAEVVKRIRTLCEARHPDSKIAEKMNAEGYQTGCGKPFNTWAVRWVRQRNHIRRHDYRIGAPPLPEQYEDGSYSIRGICKRYNVTVSVVERWLKQGKIRGRKLAYGRHKSAWRIQVDEQNERDLQEDATRSRKRYWYDRDPSTEENN